MMLQKIAIIFTGLFLISLSVTVGRVFNEKRAPDFTNLDARGMYDQILAERDYAIQQAVAAGDYYCCIEPPCTMCYMEANRWNNQTAGTCACDDLIAQGKEPCPQCQREPCPETAGICQTL
ncbi:hypothetical protein L6258_03655 [Candidatus Parcubacteria bacterium]|nr:hypothetical protein [Candidatus Parcubacteria bacterium]